MAFRRDYIILTTAIAEDDACGGWLMDIDFNAGIGAREYLSKLKFYRSLVRRLIDVAGPVPAHVDALKRAASSYSRPVRATIMTEDWCGDSACNLPILAPLFERAEIPLVVFHGSEYPQLESYYNEMNIDHIPVVSVWDGAGAEIGRWVEQPDAIGPLKDAWKAERPEFMRLYAERDANKEAARRFAALYRELLEKMAEWYIDGMWEQTTREVSECIRLQPS